MHSPTKIRFRDRDHVVLEHVSRPDGTLHLNCESDEFTGEKIELFEGDAPLASARVIGATIEFILQSENKI